MKWFHRPRHRANGIRPTAAQIIRHVKSHPMYGFKQDARGNWYLSTTISLWLPGDVDPDSPVSLVMAPPGGLTNLPALVTP